MISNGLKYFMLLLGGQMIGGLVYMNFFVSRDLDERAKNLDIVRYDSKQNKFVIKDSVILTQEMFDYLKDEVKK
jgi:hypothetical protein